MSAQNCDITFYQQGGEGGNMRFDLVCQNVPLNTMVSFRAINPDPPISLSPTRVTINTMFIVGVHADIPANYESSIIYCWELPPGVLPPADMAINLEVSFAVNE